MSEVIRAQDISVNSPNPEKPILKPTDVTIPEGFTVIWGPSGSGKSTLLNTLIGLRTPDTGTVQHLKDGEVVFQREARLKRSIGARILDAITVESRQDRRDAAYRSKNLGYVAQLPHLYPALAIGKYIEVAQTARGNSIDPEYVERLNTILGIGGHMHKDADSVSGGERQRAAIVAALAHKPNLIAADEPTSALDSESSEITMQLFRELADTGDTSIVLVSHNPAVQQYADTVVRMRDGSIER